MTSLAWVLAYFVRFETGIIPQYQSPPDIGLCYRSIPLVLLLATIAYRLTGQYVIHCVLTRCIFMSGLYSFSSRIALGGSHRKSDSYVAES